MKKIVLLSTLFLYFSSIFAADITPPVITLKNGKFQKIPISGIFVFDEPLSVSDDVTDSADIDVTLSWGYNGTVNTLKRGIYTLFIEAVDEAMNRSYDTVFYNVDEFIPPVINLNTPDTVCTELNKPYYSVQPTVTDNYYNASQISLTLKSSNVNTNIAGIYTEEYEAVDGSGNIAVKKRIVVVKANCNTVGVDRLTLSQLKIYPNPANTTIFISGLNENLNFHVFIYDALGNKVLDLETSDNVDISSLSAGLYNVTILINGELVQRKLIVGI